MEKKHRYCTHCGKELIKRDCGIITGGFDPYTGKAVKFHRFAVQCPDYVEGYSDRPYAYGDCFLEDTPIE